MKMYYDPEVDALRISFRRGKALESEEILPNVIVDYAEDGKILSIEVLYASKTLEDVRDIDKLLTAKS